MKKSMFIFALIVGAATILMAAAPVAAQSDIVWNGVYFDNITLSGNVAATRQDRAIAFEWGDTSPIAGVDDDLYSVRWGADVFLEAGSYRFWAKADDEIAITVDFTSTIINTLDQPERANEILVADITLDRGSHHIQVDYREFVGAALVYVEFANLADNPETPEFAKQEIVTEWTAEYFGNPSLSGVPSFMQTVDTPTTDWGLGSPAFNIPADFFSARFTGQATLDGSTYQISARVDDGVRVYINGALLINEWHVADGKTYTGFLELPAGQYPIVVEYLEFGGAATLLFDILPFNPAAPTVTVTASRLNVRDAPDPVNGVILTKISRDETYPALARNAAQTWVQINVNGVIGWVNDNYVDITNGATLPISGDGAPAQPNPTGLFVTATPFNVNIRTGPGASFSDIADLPIDETAIVLGRNASSTWWQINFNGIVGWVSAQYAVIQPGANISAIPITG